MNAIMIKTYFIVCLVLATSSIVGAQSKPIPDTSGIQIDFISDTQQPLLLEKIIRHSNHNTKATALLFLEILKNRPRSLYMLGDIVSLGFENNKWKKVDVFLDSCRKENIPVFGLLGNHELLLCKKKGESNFNKRFPGSVPTGYISVIDSMAIVLLNSNFKKLSSADRKKEIDWYKSALNKLDTSNAIKSIIVTCHHAPYSNSLVVGSSKPVQENFVHPFINSKKAVLFITGHSHNFEHFKIMGKDFLVIGGGGGLHQPLDNSEKRLPDVSADYKPLFHYLSMLRVAGQLQVTSHYLKNDFTGFDTGHTFSILLPVVN